mgnify:CR=1 FL=1
MANIDYEGCRKIGDSIHIQFTNGESWLIPLDDIVGDIEEQRQIAKLEIMLDVCKRDKDALRYQLEEAKRKAAQQSVHPTLATSCENHILYVACGYKYCPNCGNPLGG